MPGARQILFLLMTVVWVVLGVVCAQHDLTVSRELVNPAAGWAMFGERYGSLPGAFVLAWGAAVLYLAADLEQARSKSKDALLWVLSSICVAAALAASVYRVTNVRFTPFQGAATVLVAAAVLRAPSAVKASRPRVRPRTKLAAYWAAVLGISSWLCVHLVKLVWGRVRYRDLDAIASAFTPWYLPQGVTGHASFPSGHTAMGWMLLPLLFLWPRGSWASWGALICAVLWGIFVASSRVVIGAHYASDVLFSTAFAATVMIYARITRVPSRASPADAPFLSDVRELDAAAQARPGPGA